MSQTSSRRGVVKLSSNESHKEGMLGIHSIMINSNIQQNAFMFFHVQQNITYNKRHRSYPSFSRNQFSCGRRS